MSTEITAIPAQPKVGEMYEVAATGIPMDRTVTLVHAADISLSEAPIDEDHDGTFSIMEAQGKPGLYSYRLMDGQALLAEIDVKVVP